MLNSECFGIKFGLKYQRMPRVHSHSVLQICSQDAIFETCELNLFAEVFTLT